MALDLEKLRQFDKARLAELDRRVDDEVYGEVDSRKRAIEESRAKKRKKAAKKSRKQSDSSSSSSSSTGSSRGRA